LEHITEDDLIVYAFDAHALPEERRNAVDRHLAQCASCRTRFEFFYAEAGSMETDLRDIDVWEGVLGSATAAALFDHAARVEAEDREAETLLMPLLSSPLATAWNDVGSAKRFRTGGVARRLSAHAHSICEDRPLDALTFAEAAVSIAELLSDDLYPGHAVYEIRGTAWKECANAQMLLGRFAAALQSLDRAERAYRHLASPSLGLASAALVRAGVYYAQQKLDDAANIAEQAEHGFLHLGDEERRIAALFLRASIKYEARNLDEAASMFRHVIDYAQSSEQSRWSARGYSALASCEILRGNLNEASMHLNNALALLRAVGPVIERIRAEWAIARIILQSGMLKDAIHKLDDVIVEFERLGVFHDAALASLHKAEALLALGEMKSIVPLATRLFRVFADAGMLTGALTAIAYVKEAAANGELTAGDLEHVRMFLQRAERQPDLLFVPPPADK